MNDYITRDGPLAPRSRCTCGHVGDGPNSQHLGLMGHGACSVKGCDCQKFTWSEFLGVENKRQRIKKDLLSFAHQFGAISAREEDWPYIEELVAEGKVRWDGEPKGRTPERIRRVMPIRTDGVELPSRAINPRNKGQGGP